MSGWLIFASLLLALWLAHRKGLLLRGLRSLIERRLGGYRQAAFAVDASLPRVVRGAPPKVAVIGGGLAGIAAASTLGERGFEVILYERNPYLGGKIGAWKQAVGDTEQTIEHGFHAFFRQYYNLNHFLDQLGLRESFRPIEDYLIIDREGHELSFGEVETTPGLNIIGLGRRGFYRWRDVIGKPTRKRLDAFIRFDMEPTYAAFDEITFKEFCDAAGLPAELRVSFRTFARAFFADEADLSTADVLRAFHFYYLSHDHGLMYDFPAGDYEATLLAPIRRHLREVGVDLRLGASVGSIEAGGSRRFLIDGEELDWVVMAADIPGAQKLLEASPTLEAQAPELSRKLRGLKTSHGYAVWRIYVDQDLRPGLPTFVNVDRMRALDSVTLYHRITEEAQQWAGKHDGAVLELHSYALPKELSDEDAVRQVLREELEYYFPELAGFRILGEALQVRNDFPAFAPGQRDQRPDPQTELEGLLMAGDWVRLPYPMTHMEAAFTSGLMCANAVLQHHTLQRAPIDTVAPRGLLRGDAIRV
jgi:isorenieratene synthase